MRQLEKEMEQERLNKMFAVGPGEGNKLGKQLLTAFGGNRGAGAAKLL